MSAFEMLRVAMSGAGIEFTTFRTALEEFAAHFIRCGHPVTQGGEQ
jgi:hypothetical protein